ncbi:hypothetical protein HBH56_231020 [Parastagonospora nodorum]|uniref:N-acetyltransferase domain-containing protein n=2 Tax=Phaeosphaeria nodorum (strain SN15 / ATCC MYA-4574 / FGSC 10173) TaxID=321614 RepID=A0A7U2FAI1_PHANO|nr:hypothetical protein SNOG_14366 [Parastagonospora nodorum SN15]KAH3904692.1 hypothetical protein HBH56_231020 [Parastagonospora nodorum]EAT78237.1 hypothetical protein SNOG_14366 [Parastagonospora nodorum SN15]KAH3924388.1 hypothetical protein HBH54_194140 [Parastagonospora nodorum]KAH3993559.1 hypothetical protein HBI10_199410 [Parastagonospora nodorum]KAH4012251.1 hypothetical protein HBI13_190750 [Parastagonospora nodorum]
MGFVVLPALVPDISAVYDVYFAAFKDNAVSKALFPSATASDMTNPESEFRKAHTGHTTQYWPTDSTQYTLKCVDSETGEIVGMALWEIYLTTSKWRRGKISWLSGEERERAEALISPLWNAREKLWLDQKYIYCHAIAVHPDYQRKGIGKLLMEFGIGVAQQVELPIYIESSEEGVRLYEKLGCQRVRQPKSGEVPNAGQSVNGGQEHGLSLFVWVPKGSRDYRKP